MFSPLLSVFANFHWVLLPVSFGFQWLSGDIRWCFLCLSLYLFFSNKYREKQKGLRILLDSRPLASVLNRIIRLNHHWPRIRHKKLRKTLALLHAK